MNTLLRVSRVIDAVTDKVGQLAGYIVMLTILVGLYNAVLRYVGRITGQRLVSALEIELQWYLFSITFFLGFSYVLKINGHVRTDFRYSKFTPRQRAWVNLLGTLLFLLPFCVLAVWVTLNPVVISWQQQEASPDPGGLPRFPIKTFIIVAFVLLFVQGISEAIKHAAALTGALKGKELEAVEEYEAPAID